MGLKNFKPFKRQPHTTVKHTQTIRRQQSTNCLNVFDHFVRLALKGLKFLENVEHSEHFDDVMKAVNSNVSETVCTTKSEEEAIFHLITMNLILRKIRETLTLKI